MACPIKRHQIICFVAVLLVLFAGSLPGEASVRIEPSRFIFHIPPGGRETGAIIVTNNSENPVNLKAAIYDWDVNKKNELVEYEMGTLKETLDGLIRFNPRQFSLGAGESQIVRFTISFPEGEEEHFERRAIIFFEEDEDPEMDEGLGAVIRTMIGATIYARPSEFSFNFLLIEGLVLSGPSGQQVAALLMGNPSFVHARFTISYRVVTVEGEIFEEGDVSEKVFLPETARPIYIPLKKTYPPGEYKLILDLKFTDIDFRLNEVVPFRVEE